jgi:hypothetical protein
MALFGNDLRRERLILDWPPLCANFFLFWVGAAFGTTAASPLIHIAGITPEATNPASIAEMIELSSNRRQEITIGALDETFRLLDQQDTPHGVEKEEQDDESRNSIDWVALGNPHLSLSECDELLRLLENEVPAGTGKHKDVSVMAWCVWFVLFVAFLQILPFVSCLTRPLTVQPPQHLSSAVRSVAVCAKTGGLWSDVRT